MLAGLTEVLAEGKKRKIAIGSFNTPNLECLLAVLDAAEELNVPVIIAHAQCHEDVAPLDKIGPVMVELAKRSKVKVCVHLDHGEDFEYCRRAMRLGFTSVMIDYSILMARKKRLQSDFNLSEHQVTSLARVLLPAIREYLLSEQGKKDYVEWTENKQKQLNKTKKSQ